MALAPGRRAGPTAALFAARVVYAFNWYNVGAVLPLIGLGLSAGPAALGVVLGAFLVGVGIFQVPAGVASLRYGARRVSLAGLLGLGAAGLASAIAPSWEALAALRFLAGVGAAFFFSPALSLIASYYPPGRRGPVIGLFNGGFSVGGAAGLVAGAALGEVAGWPAALAVGGAALLATTAIAAATLPAEIRPGPRVGGRPAVWAAAREVVGSRSIWALAVGLSGFWGALFIVAQYFVAFGRAVHPGWSTGLVAGLAALVVIVSFPAGPLGGWLGERGPDRRVHLAVFATVGGALTLAIPWLGLAGLVADLIALGVVDGTGFAVLYLLPTYLPEAHGEGLALGVAVVNAIQVALGSGFAVLFGLLVAGFGYPAAWTFAGLLTVGLLPALLFVAPSRPAPRDVGSDRPRRPR